MEHAIPLDARFQLLLKEFSQVMPQEDAAPVGIYLLFLQVAGESFQDRQAFQSLYSF